jgi:uncharacterized protein (DUF2141 family)
LPLGALALIGATPVSGLRVEVEQLRNARGKLQYCLTADPHNFPDCVNDARAITRSVRAADAATLFDGLPRGEYALAVIHDENGNSKLDTFAGIPREGFGFSRNPKIGFGPPRFTAARFTLDQSSGEQRVRMRYMF